MFTDTGRSTWMQALGVKTRAMSKRRIHAVERFSAGVTCNKRCIYIYYNGGDTTIFFRGFDGSCATLMREERKNVVLG